MVRHLAVGNGSLLVNLDRDLRVRDIYFPYAGQENHVLGKPQRIGIHGRGFSWLSDWDTVPGYKEDTLVTESKARNKDEELEINFESCVHCQENVFLRKITFRNLSEEEREVEIFFEHDVELYGSQLGDTAFYHPYENSMVQYKQNRYLMVNIIEEERGFTQYGVYRKDPSEDIRKGDLNGKPISQGEVRFVVSKRFTISPEGEQHIHYTLNSAEDMEEVIKNEKKAEESIEDYFNDTERCWIGFLGLLKCDTSSMEEEIADKLKRSVLIIRSQTNDNGAITAANDSDNIEFNSDKYGYVWPRDGALIADTMIKAGYHDLVRPFFTMMEKLVEPGGYLMHKYNPDGSLGSSWHPWIDEEGEKQLPIQEDETALVVWALETYLEETGDTEFVEKKYETLVEPACEFMDRYFDEKLHLPQPSYDLWEEKRYISTFTVASVYAGLMSGYRIAEKLGKDGERFRKRAEEIRTEGLENLRSEEKKRYGRGLVEGELDDSISAPLIFLWKFGLVDGSDEYFRNSLNAIRYDLSPDTDIGGIARYRGDHYHASSQDFDRIPGNPWFICTLWVGQYLIKTAENQDEIEEGREFLRWVCRNSLDTGLMPEQADPFTGEPKSVCPLTWSHSTMIETALLLDDRRNEIL